MNDAMTTVPGLPDEGRLEIPALGPEAARAVERLLAVDPLEILPSRIPEVPE